MTIYRKNISDVYQEMSDDPKVMITDQYQRRRRPQYEDLVYEPKFKHKRQPVPPRPIKFDQWIFPHLNALWYDYNNKSNIAASANSDVITHSCKQDGVFRWFGHMVDDGSDASYWDYGTWIIKKNGLAYPPWDNITQMIALLHDPCIILIPFVNGDEIVINVTNTDSSAHDYYTKLKGWTFVY